MADRVKTELGAVQETLFIPLAARARETRRRRPALRDPRAAEILASVDFDAKKYGRGSGGGVTVLRTAIFDGWVGDFLTGHPDGTVVELGTGLNTRFERVGQEAAVTRPPPGLRARLPRRYRYALPLAHRIAGDLATVTLFRACSSGE